MNKVTRYQDLLDADHAALVKECKRIDRALALGVDPYAKTLDSMPRLAIKRLKRQGAPLPPSGILGALGSVDPTAALIRA